MNWLFGKSRSNLPEPTALQTQKSKQIEQLKAFNQNVTEIHRDVEYRVNFIVNGCPISLYITLPPQFPQDKPQVKVAPPVRHPWVNDQMIVTGCAGLNTFMMHSDLGKVIRSIVDEFQKTPLTILPQSQQPFGGGMPATPYPLHPPGGVPGQPQPQLPAYTPYSQHGPVAPPSYMPSVPMPTLPPAPGQVPTSSYQQQQQIPVSGTGGNMGAPPPTSMSTCMVAPAVIPPSSVSATPSFHPPDTSVLHQDINTQLSSLHGSETGRSYQTPDLPVAFTQLHGLSTSELKSLADDEDRLLQLVMELPELSQIAADREEICNKNEELARENLLKKPQLEEKKRILLEKYDELNDLRRTFDEYSERQEELRSAYDPQTLQANLKVAAQQAEEEAEVIAEEFIEGKINVQEFNRKFLQKKTLGHLRKAKEEKLSQYIYHNRPF